MRYIDMTDEQLVEQIKRLALHIEIIARELDKRYKPRPEVRDTVAALLGRARQSAIRQ